MRKYRSKSVITMKQKITSGRESIIYLMS